MTPRPLLFRGGTVLPLDPLAPRTDALLVRDGHVVALGEDALDRRGPRAQEVDLAGGALLPAFADGHAHPSHGGVELLDAPVRDCASVAEVVEVVRRHAAAHPDTGHPDAEWVLGSSYDPSLAPGGRFDARWLDAAVPDRPVALTSADHHVLWVNTEALRRAGITRDTPDPPSSGIARRDDGEALGTLVEWGAMDLVRRVLPERTEADLRRGLRSAWELMAGAGIAWVQDALCSPGDLDRALSLAREGPLPVRSDLCLRAEPGSWVRQHAEFRAARAAAADDPQVGAGTVKLFADGVVEAGTAALLEPYEGSEADRGMPVWQPDELAAAAAAFDADGFRLHVHAIGDAAVRAALDAVEHVARVNGPADRRPVVAHTQLVHRDDLPRFAALGVVANFSPLWACLDACQTDLTAPRLGPGRSARQYPMASLVASGAVLSFGSDWPVSSLRPLDGLGVAVTRRTPDGDPPGGWVPQERLPVAAALSAATQGPAYQVHEEHLRGTLTPGRRADLVHLAADPTRVDAQDWPGIGVLGTWLGGRRTA